MPNLRRRGLLRGAAAATFLGAFPGVRILAMPGPFDDYRALVCVFLFGGNDAWNILVPRSDAEYAVYADSRQYPGHRTKRAVAHHAPRQPGSPTR